MTIVGIDYPITIIYRLRGGKWMRWCELCKKPVICIQSADRPIELGWMYWKTLS